MLVHGVGGGRVVGQEERVEDDEFDHKGGHVAGWKYSGEPAGGGPNGNDDEASGSVLF